MAYVVKKKPWLGAILVFLFGPFGFFYYSWKKAITSFLIFFFPTVLFFAFYEDQAGIIQWGFQFLMAVFAYFDLDDKMESLYTFVGHLITLFMVPIMLLNLLGGIVITIWLVCLGYWKIVLRAYLFAIVTPWAYLIVGLFLLPFVALMSYAERENKKILGLFSGYINLLISDVFILFYVFLILFATVDYAELKDINIFLALLFGYGIATGPFSYMASKGDELSSMIGVFISQVTYILGAVAYLFGEPRFSVPIILLIVFLLQAFRVNLVSDAWSAEQKAADSELLQIEEGDI